jgi:uncharacterized protein YggU (UPF0235/DUF167 family)
MFEVAVKRREDRGAEPMPPTQITRALAELGIGRISAHSPQAKGRIERCFGTLQDRLVKHLRLAKAKTLQEANEALEEFLAEWNQRFTVKPANATDAHRPLGEDHDLEAILSHVEERRIANDFTVQFLGKRYQIEKSQVQAGMRGQTARLELRLDGLVALRYQGRYLMIRRCEGSHPELVLSQPAGVPPRKDHNRGGRSDWMKGFSVCSDARPSERPNRNAGQKQPGGLRV